MQNNGWRDELICEHAETARRIALKLARRCPAFISREDLVAAGMLGLTEAARRYDRDRAEPFLPYAERRIRGAVLDELRRGDLLPRRVRQLARKIATTIRAIENSGEAATETNIARALDVTIERYRDDLAHLVNIDISSLDADGATVLVDDQQPVDELAVRRLTMARVRTSIATLEARDVTLLHLHFFEELTFQDIASQLGITASRVCQLLWRAVERLRGLLGISVLDTQAVA
ncbi:MAG: sigma-70 family RNA polymerase sigma factor [Kofleriaceae bacterium]